MSVKQKLVKQQFYCSTSSKNRKRIRRKIDEALKTRIVLELLMKLETLTALASRYVEWKVQYS